MSGNSHTGRWRDNLGNGCLVIQRNDGCVHVDYDDGSWTCADARTFERWVSWGWTREDAAPRSKGESDV